MLEYQVIYERALEIGHRIEFAKVYAKNLVYFEDDEYLEKIARGKAYLAIKKLGYGLIELYNEAIIDAKITNRTAFFCRIYAEAIVINIHKNIEGFLYVSTAESKAIEYEEVYKIYEECGSFEQYHRSFANSIDYSKNSELFVILLMEKYQELMNNNLEYFYSKIYAKKYAELTFEYLINGYELDNKIDSFDLIAQVYTEVLFYAEGRNFISPKQIADAFIKTEKIEIIGNYSKFEFESYIDNFINKYKFKCNGREN